MLKFEISSEERPDLGHRVTKFSGEFTDLDLVNIDFDELDRALMRDKMESEADYLLVLEMIFRRWREQTQLKPTA
jgi:hypothetical protein